MLCDGKHDCGADDITDEMGCPSEAKVKVRLVGGRTQNQGWIEVKAFDYPYGGVCDDGFNIEEANVVCRQAGYPLGAKQVLTLTNEYTRSNCKLESSQAIVGSEFGHGTGQILLDELECTGSESSILECSFNPWTKHDCRNSEWAGVICKIQEESCQDEVGLSKLQQSPDKHW